MSSPRKIDFKKVGFHAGLEVHHQIRSDRKLFCNCPPNLEKDPRNMSYSFYRYFRPVLGEMGDFDAGMLVEYEKGYKVTYLACEENTCTYEMDETPPFHPDMNAIKEGFTLAYYFNCSALAEEVVVCRKQYLDGSITTGFQRTLIVGRDGWIPVNGKKVRVTNVHIEEDAARRVDWLDTANRNVCFNLDRLGIPLTEVITDHRDIDNPDELIELAKQIGRVLRISRIGRRGIGAVRQDVNLSINDGNRVEIKGVQDLSVFELMCRCEVMRQNALIQIKKEMEARKLCKKDFEHTYIDVSQVFSTKDGTKALVTVFPGMKGIFGTEVQPGKDFGGEIFEKSMLITGVSCKSQSHSDEFHSNADGKKTDTPSQLCIDEAKYSQLHEILRFEDKDAFVLVFGPEKKAMHALKIIVERVKLALDGVPQETRRLLSSGNSEFLRVIHGKERIYPDTDTPPIPISKEVLEECKQRVLSRPWEISERLVERHGLSQRQIDLLIRDEKIEKFLDYTERLDVNAHIAFRLLVDLQRNQKRRKRHVVSARALDELTEELANGRLTLAQVERAIMMLENSPNARVKDILMKSEFRRMNDDELDGIILTQLEDFNTERIRSDELYRTAVLPKIVGKILKLANYSTEGENILKRILTRIGE